MRGGSTADFISAREDNTESEDDEFFDPKLVKTVLHSPLWLLSVCIWLQ